MGEPTTASMQFVATELLGFRHPAEIERARTLWRIMRNLEREFHEEQRAGATPKRKRLAQLEERELDHGGD